MGSPAAHLGRIRITPYDVVRTILGLILLTAAALKGHQLATEPLAETGLLTSRWFLIGVVEFELFFGLWLCCGLYPRRTCEGALLCFSAFACVSLYKALSGEATCGCFGRVPVSPWYTLILDLAAVAGLICFRPPREKRTSPLRFPGEGPGARGGRGARLRWVFGLFVAAGLPGGLAMATYRPAVLDDSGDIFGDSQFVVLEPEKWIGQRFPLLKYIDISDQLTEGQWIVVLYRHDCPYCRELLAEFERLSGGWALDPLAPRVALIEMAPYEDGDESIVSRGVPPVLGHLKDTRAWFGATPIRLLLKEGVVIEGMDWDAHRVAGWAYWGEYLVARRG